MKIASPPNPCSKKTKKTHFTNKKYQYQQTKNKIKTSKTIKNRSAPTKVQCYLTFTYETKHHKTFTKTYTSTSI